MHQSSLSNGKRDFIPPWQDMPTLCAQEPMTANELELWLVANQSIAAALRVNSV
jgi:hypothetical protein